MRVPRELLRDTVTIEDFGGSGARGPVYDAPRSVRGSVQPTSRLATSQNAATGSFGVTVVIDALVVIRPEDGPVRPESRVTARGVGYRVVQSYPMPDERRPSHYELALARHASAGGVGSGS